MLYTELTSSAQKEALERFKSKGFPTNKWEEWKYASLKSWNEKDLDWTPAALTENLSASLQTQNGNTSFQGTLPAGVEFIPFDAFMAANPTIAAKWHKFDEAHLNRIVFCPDNEVIDFAVIQSLHHYHIYFHFNFML